MTGLSHEHSHAIEAAAEWLALDVRKRIGRPIISLLRQTFGLTVEEAMAAVREAQRLREGEAS